MGGDARRRRVSLNTKESVGAPGFAFGEAVKLPTRLRFRELPPNARPKSDAMRASKSDFGGVADQKFVEVVVDRWRSATINTRLRAEGTDEEAAPTAGSGQSSMDRRVSDAYRALKKANADGIP